MALMNLFIEVDMTAIVATGCAALGAAQISFINHLKQQGIEADEYFGPSSGGVISSICGQVSPEDAIHLWRDVQGFFDVFKFNWKFWQGLVSLDPLREILEPHYKRPPIKPANVVALNMVTKQLHWFSNSDMPPAVFLERTLDAARIQGLVKPESELMDAGPKKLAPIGRAIKRGHKDIVVVTGYPPEYTRDEPTKSGLKLGLMGLNLMLHGRTWGDIRQAIIKNNDPNLTKINLRVFGPDKHLYNGFDFSKGSVGLQAKPVEYSHKRIMDAL